MLHSRPLRPLPLLLALCLCLTTGCQAMLERSYESVTDHVDRPATAEGSSAVQVETYQELVSAVLYFVSQAQATGTIQFRDYTGDVDSDLSKACLEVTSEDPLGAYAVDYIKYELTRVMSHYQADLTVGYRRESQQIRSIVNVTGASAIRAELRSALEQFSTETVLRVAYFSGDTENIQTLLRQAYYDTPATALGFPQCQVTLYPEQGSQRIVEISLTYPATMEVLQQQAKAVRDRCTQLTAQLDAPPTVQTAQQAAQLLSEQLTLTAAGSGSVYDALVGGSCDSTGFTLAYALLCRQLGLSIDVVEGSVNGSARLWAQLTAEGQTLFLDPLLGPTLQTQSQLTAAGYQWESMDAARSHKK